MTKTYQARPSSLLGIDDEYTAYCLDEACCLISMKIQNKELPVFSKHIDPKQKAGQGAFSAMYQDLGVKENGS